MISLQQIRFRHGPGAAALPLLKEGRPVTEAEWTEEGGSGPAAYRIPSAPERVVIIASFATSDEQLAAVRIRARRSGEGPGCIGDIEPVAVTFDADGASGLVRCQLRLRGDAAVDIEAVEWIWEAEIQDEWREIGRTTHEIATVLGTPKAPWTVEDEGGARPWWEVMQIACEAARGARTPEEAMSALTHLAYDTWGRHFYQWRPSTNYASDRGAEPAVFDCARFLRLLNDQDEPELVDCADTAAIVATFAAILGCPALQKSINVPGEAKRLLMVGHTQWREPNPFGIHEFGGLDPAGGTVWDACLRLTPNGERVQPAEALLPAEMSPGEYLSLLIDEPHTMSDLERDPESRAIGVLDSVRQARAGDVLVRLAADRLSLSVVPPGPSPQRRATHIRLQHLRLNEWRLVETSRPEAVQPTGSELEPVARALWRHVAQRQMVACEVYLCNDAEAARLRALTMLGRLIPYDPRPSRVMDPSSPDLEFEASEGKAVVASFLNTATQVRIASRLDVSRPTIRDFFQLVQGLISRAAQP